MQQSLADPVTFVWGWTSGVWNLMADIKVTTTTTREILDWYHLKEKICTLGWWLNKRLRDVVKPASGAVKLTQPLQLLPDWGQSSSYKLWLYLERHRRPPHP
jgi:hypothetical protein